MTDLAYATQTAALAVGGLRDCRDHRRSGRRSQKRDAPMNGSRLDSVISVPAPGRTLPMLLAELVELGREAWRISERERAVRAEINALREIEEKVTAVVSSPPG